MKPPARAAAVRGDDYQYAVAWVQACTALLVDHQNRVRVGEVVDHVPAQVVPDRIGVPLRPGK